MNGYEILKQLDNVCESQIGCLRCPIHDHLNDICLLVKAEQRLSSLTSEYIYEHPAGVAMLSEIYEIAFPDKIELQIASESEFNNLFQ